MIKKTRFPKGPTVSVEVPNTPEPTQTPEAAAMSERLGAYAQEHPEEFLEIICGGPPKEGTIIIDQDAAKIVLAKMYAAASKSNN